ncbi:MAG TPA: hypothetical protein VFO89_14715 [Thermoanaerobaculia bacterium]|nr:hypothetical protein [Thermoanaerobaculia bacterium]
MKVTIFQSASGDCVLLSAGSGRSETHVLVDGGMGESYTQHVGKAISRLPHLDLIYVSHIDGDHIGGVLRMIDDAFDWKLYRYRLKKNVKHPKPKSAEPPPMRGIWHNAFHDQIPDDAGAVEDMALMLAEAGNVHDAYRDAAIRSQEYALSIPQALRLSERIGIRQLGLKVNQGRGKLLMARRNQRPVKIGPMTFTILAPFAKDLEKLRSEWKQWLDSAAGKKETRRLRARSVEDAKSIVLSSFAEIEGELIEASKRIGDPSSVTPPNVASLMAYVEEDGKTVLLTGDGLAKTVLDGLEVARIIPKGGSLHVNVLKVQHHGSINNVDFDFARHVTADHYIFCGNGGHGNPYPDVVQYFFDSRVGKERAAHAPNRKFHFWFSSHSSVTQRAYVKAMRAVEKRVAELEKQQGGEKLITHFLTKSAHPPLRI